MTWTLNKLLLFTNSCYAENETVRNIKRHSKIYEARSVRFCQTFRPPVELAYFVNSLNVNDGKFLFVGEGDKRFSMLI